MPFFIILTSYLVNNATQSSSRNLLMEIREFVERLLRTCPVAADGERWVDRGTWTDWEAFMKEAFAAETQGPLGVNW